MAKEVEKRGACIYSFTRTYGEMMPANKFIRHLEKAIQMTEKEYGGNLYERNAEEIISPKGELSSMLMTLNFQDTEKVFPDYQIKGCICQTPAAP